MEERKHEPVCRHCGYIDGAVAESLLHLPLGTLLRDKYLIDKVLGQGGFGITYLALDTTLQLKLVIKEYLPMELAARLGNQEQVSVYEATKEVQFKCGLSKFLDEARMPARFIEHPNVVTVRDYFEANGTAYIVMDYIEGMAFEHYLTANGGRISFEQALKVIMPVLDALAEAHKMGILHRDISPDNIYIDINGQVKLIDFGAARQEMQQANRSRSVIMKVGYSPLEQYQSKGKQGASTDIYALGATLYRAITGQAPVEVLDRLQKDELNTPSELPVKIKAAAEKALLKAIAINADERSQKG